MSAAQVPNPLVDLGLTVSGGSPNKAAESAAMRERRAAAWRCGLAELLERRPELRGIYRPADFAAESVRWSA